MARPDFLKKWASSRVSIPAISDPDYALGFAAYLGSQPPTTDDHDYIMNLQDQRAVWLGEQMLNAVGHEWQSDVTYDAYAVVRSPVNGQLYRSLVGSNLGNEPSVSGSQWALGVQPLSTDFLNTTRINVASAATVNLTSSAPNTRHINITGTTTITAFTVAAGQCYFVRFAGALTLTNSASIVTQRGANITTAAGDTCILRATAANVVEVLSYTSVVAQSIGVGQSWQDVLASRVSGTTYTNSTGRPIMVSVSRKKGANDMTVTVAGVIVARVEGYGLSDQDNLCFVVPDGQTYLVTASATPLGTWTELR